MLGRTNLFLVLRLEEEEEEARLFRHLLLLRRLFRLLLLLRRQSPLALTTLPGLVSSIPPIRATTSLKILIGDASGKTAVA